MVIPAVFAGTLVVAMIWDLLRLEIPDTASLVLLAAFLAGALGTGVAPAAILANAAAAAAVFAVGLWLFARNVWGGGDVKLAAALSLWFGWNGLLEWTLAVAIAGGLLALAILLFRRLPGSPRWPAWLKRLHQPENGIPYGIALGIGALACFDGATAFLSAPPAQLIG